MYRNLAIRTYPEFDSGIPVEPTHWSLAELAEWKAALAAVRRIDERFEKRWDAMLEYRASRLEFYQYASSANLPAEVVQELPLGHVASRAFWVAPAVELSSHVMAGLLSSMKARTSGTKREAKIVGKVIRTWNSRKAFRVDRNRSERLWAVIPGGLCMNVDEAVSRPTISIEWNGEQIAEVYATVAQLAELRRFVRHWRTMARNLMAASMSLALPVVPKLGAQTFLCLPLRGSQRKDHNAVVVSKTTPQLVPGPVLKSVTLVKHYRDEDWAERFELSGQFLLALDRLLPSQADKPLSSALNVTLATLIREHFEGNPFRRLRPDSLDEQDALSRADDVTRKRVTRYGSSGPVAIEADGELCAVHHPVWPQKTIRFKSLALAIDFERSNRETKGIEYFAKAE